MYYFCTYFDHNYLSRGLLMYDSLKKHCKEFRLFVLALSDDCFDFLYKTNLPNIILISLKELEQDNRELLKAKQNRSLIEYYFTLTPFLPNYILKKFYEVDLITYLDADLYFFADPKPIFDEINNKSIAIISHNFPKKIQNQCRFGIYNVGWVSFRRDNKGIECLNYWQKLCYEWCYDRLENGKYADQKYLDDWSDKFQNLAIIKHKGANTAPWNVDNYDIRYKNSKILIDNDLLIFFHFHGIKIIINLAKYYIYDIGFGQYKALITPTLRDVVYVPYLKKLINLDAKIKKLINYNFNVSNIRDKKSISKTKKIYEKLDRLLVLIFKIIISSRYIIMPKKNFL